MPIWRSMALRPPRYPNCRPMPPRSMCGCSRPHTTTVFQGPGFLLHTRNGALLRWCLEHGLRISYPMTQMSYSLYQEPSGSLLPLILY